MKELSKADQRRKQIADRIIEHGELSFTKTCAKLLNLDIEQLNVSFL